MASTARDSLVQSVKTLLAQVEELPENVYDDEAGRQALRKQIRRIKDDMTSPVERIYEELFFQPHQSIAARIALDGKWLEVLADGRPKTARDIASATGAETELIRRIMMVLTATNVVGEQGPQTYVATRVTQTLLNPGWANGLRFCSELVARSIVNLPSYLRRNGYKVPQDVKTGPFADAWGGNNTWALYEADPTWGAIFNSFMATRKQGTRVWTDIYPAKSNLCNRIERSEDAVLLVDIGGGVGHVLKEFAKDPAHRTGRLILQDLPAALVDADADALEEQGIEKIAYDFFTPQPVRGAKAYYFRAVMHDWPNSACHEILNNTASAMRKDYSKLLIDDIVLPDCDVPLRGAMYDLHMLAIECGTERTSTQWYDLLRSAGLQIEKIWSTDSRLESVIEAVLAK
ncbi:MAG: hypothetical protein Q9214_006136 [Letrouitia sp. 1 TL-2023]